MKSKLKRILLVLTTGLVLTSCNQIPVDDEGYQYRAEDDIFYRADFVNYDNSYLYSTHVRSGEYAIYGGPTPTRDRTDTYTYTFMGWDKDTKETPIVQNTTFKAVYAEEFIEKYTVTFMNWDGEVLYETVVDSGESAFYVGDTPTRPTDDDGTTYIFSGWNKSYEDIQEDTVVVASYESRKGRYTVTFYNYDEVTVLGVEYAYKGDSVTYHGETPAKPSYQNQAYEFVGWDIDLNDIQGDTIAIAQFEATDRYVTVTYHDYKGDVLYQDSVPYGSSSYYWGSTPTKPFNGRYKYDFDSWSEDLSCVQYDIDVFPKFTESIREETYGLEFYNVYDDYWTPIGYYVGSYWGTEKDVYVPSMHNGKPVLSIHDSVFNYGYVETIFIEDGITEIFSGTFRNCTYLKELRLPEGLESCSFEFYGTDRLEKLEIPSTVTYISESSLRSIGNSDLEVIISSKNKTYSSDSGFILDKDGETLLFAYKYLSDEITIPRGVKYISEYCLGSNSITKISLPRSVKRIGSYAFQNSGSLNSVNFNGCSAEIDDSAFQHCYNLDTIENYSNITKLGNYAFASTGLSEFTIYSSLTSMKYDTFESTHVNITIDGESDYFDEIDGLIYKKDLTDLIYIPYGELGTIHLPKELIEFPLSVLNDGERFITSFEVEEGNKQLYSIDGCLYNASKTTLYYVSRDLEVLSNLPSETTTIDAYASRYNSTLEKIDLTNSNVNIIESYAFQSCSNLTEAKVRFANSYSYNDYNLNGEYAFYDCDNLTSVTILSGSTTVPTHAFYNCSYLNSVIISSGVTSIGSNAFDGDYSLMEVVLPSTLTSIGTYAFSSCSQLVDISLPSSLTTLESGAFIYCSSLKSISLPETLTYIGDQAFSGCYALSEANIPNNLTSVPSNMFSSTALTSISIPSKVTTIDYGAFSSCSNLTSVSLSNKLSTINDSAFSNCSSLKDITLPSSLTYIGSNAFSSCSSLTEISFPSNVSTISSYAFSYCSGLTSVTIPSTVSYVGSGAFMYCSSLKEVTINCSSASVANSVFEGCNLLSTVYWNSSNDYYGYITTFNSCYLTKFVVSSDVSSFNLDYISSSYYYSSTFSFGCSVNTNLYTNYYGYPSFKNVYFDGSLTDYLAKGMYANIFTSDANVYFRSSTGSVTFEGKKYEKPGDRIELPSGATSTQSYMFSGFDSSVVKLPSSLTYVNDQTFYNSRISSVIIESTNILYLGYQNSYNTNYYLKAKPTTFYNNIEYCGVNTSQLYFYSSSKPTNTDYSWWHYDSNNNPVIWEL